jgi:hypothetical protein
VSTRIARVITFTRLPTGHTHEDIDQCFSVIWRIFRRKPGLTLKEYKEKIEQCFVSVWIIPDYSSILEPYVDSHLACLHKQLQTQHQWRFEELDSNT